jgi:para-aminobenzoate synthetase / 4-amino-4-deoxychorismate lyase
MSALPHADPGRGVFETMLVIAGRAVALDAHLGRLTKSVEALYGSALPGDAQALVVDRAGGIGCGKIRLTFVPGRDEPQLDVSGSEIDPESVFPTAARGATLRTHVVAGGLGEHKWVDRDLLECLARRSDGALPLLLDADGAVLEASRASIFIVDGARLVTPPTDGRILPSLARRQAIEVAGAAGIDTGEGRLTIADLLSREVFLTGSVRGIEPVASLDGVEQTPTGRVSELLAAGLRRRWRVPATEPVAVAAGEPPGGRPEH